MLHRLRAGFPDGTLVVIRDGAPGHRAKAVRRWLREDVTDHHGHPTAEDLTRRVANFEAQANQAPHAQAPHAAADRLWIKDHLDPNEEKLRLPI